MKPEKDCTAAVNGAWRGWYAYPNNQRKPVRFTAKLEATAKCRFRGRMEEPNTFGRKGSPKLYATLVGTISGRNVSFVKTYDGTAGVSHSVQYKGELAAGTGRIKGSWRIRGSGSGLFEMTR